MSWISSRMGYRVFRPQVAERFSSSMVKQIRTAPTGVQMIGGAACLGLGALIASGLSQPASYVPANSRKLMGEFGGKAYAARVRNRIASTYGALTVGLGMTAATAVMAYRGGLAMRMMQMNPWMLMGITLFGTIGCMMGTQMTDKRNPLKYVWWTGFNACVGLSLVPVGMFGGAIVSQAAMITGVIVGSLSAVAAASPGDTFLSMGPMLGCGLGVIIAASLGQVFFPASTLLMNVSLYGGLGLFGLYTCYDTQKIMYHAQMDNDFDPINRQIGIYMDTINIFIRVAQILAMSNRRK